MSGARPVLRNNSIVNNKLGLIAVSTLAEVEARFNWWGDASGPKHPNNPNGLGQEIRGAVAFEPWLASPDDTGGGTTGITVDLNGPGRFSPGDTVLYSIFYHNGTGNPIDNAVLRFGMPANAVLLETSSNSIFHSERNHVFWKLGSLPQNGQGCCGCACSTTGACRKVSRQLRRRNSAAATCRDRCLTSTNISPMYRAR